MSELAKRILIVGTSAVSLRFARFLAEKYDFVEKIFVTSLNKFDIDNEKIEIVDLREDDLTGLLTFVLQNDVQLTFPTSVQSVKNGLSSFFQLNGQAVFGPTEMAGKIVWHNVYAKKFLYKIRAYTFPFSAFDKFQYANDYLKTVTFPILIRTEEYNGLEDRLVCSNVSLAHDFLEKLFSKGESNVLIEEFQNKPNFTVYYITDGYKAVPITTVSNYKFASDGDSGFYTQGCACYSPSYKISSTVLEKLNKFVSNVLNSLDNRGNAYMGVFGVNCTLKNEEAFYVNEFYNFFQDYDISSVLNSFEDDFLKIASDCIQGLFADEYDEIKTNELSSVSAVVSAKSEGQKIFGLDNLDCGVDFINVKKSENIYKTTKGRNLVLTSCSSTLNSAKNKLYSNLEEIKFNGLQYRKDIAKVVEN